MVKVRQATEFRGDAAFVEACHRANEALGARSRFGVDSSPTRPGYRKVEPTKRQYSKYRRGFGSAYDFGRRPA